MFVVYVDLTIRPEDLETFLPLMRANAKASLETEPGCRQFDVIGVSDAPTEFMLYELYDDKAAFDAHLKTQHFLEFDAKVADMVTHKAVRTGTVIA